MKIGILTQEYHTGEQRFGGASRAMGKIANWLAESGHEVTVYMQGRVAAESLERPGLRVVLVSPHPRIHWRLRALAGRLSATLRGLIWHYEVNRALGDRIIADYRKGLIDVLLTNRGVTAPSLMIRRQLPTVVRAQLALPPVKRLEKVPVNLLDRYLHLRERRAMRKATRVYAPSRLIAGLRQRDAGRVIPILRTPMFALWEPSPWEDVRERHHLPDKFLLYWGGLLYCKGIHTLIDALPQVMHNMPEISFVFVGDREARDRFGRSLGDRLRSCANDFEPRVRLLPSLEQNDVFAIIKRAHAVVLPSVIDNLPNTLLEAMYFEKVIVASQGASLDELLEDGKSAVLFPKGEARGLADAIERVCRLSVDTRREMGKAAREKLQQTCQASLVMEQLVQLCEDAVDAHKASMREKSHDLTQGLSVS